MSKAAINKTFMLSRLENLDSFEWADLVSDVQRTVSPNIVNGVFEVTESNSGALVPEVIIFAVSAEVEDEVMDYLTRLGFGRGDIRFYGAESRSVTKVL